MAVAELPDESTPVQVTIVSPSGNDSGASFVMVTSLTESVVVGSPSEILFSVVDVASNCTSDGEVMVGAMVSCTVMVWVAVAELPAASVAVQVIVVTPSLKWSGASLVTETTSTRSFDFMVPKSTEFLSSLVASIVTSNTRMSGFVVSTMFTFCCAVLIKPDESVAVQVMMVSPTGNNSGASFVMVSIPTLSETEGVSSVMVFSSLEVASWVMSVGAVMVGEVVSVMVTF